MRQLFLAAFLSTGFSLFDEPPRLSNRSLPRESGAEDARTPDASRLPGVSEPREASGVHPIYRRFPSGAGQPAVRGPNAWHQSRGDFPRSLKRVGVMSSNRGFSKDSSPEIEPHYPDCCEIARFSNALSVAERVDRGLENRQVRFEKLLIVFP